MLYVDQNQRVTAKPRQHLALLLLKDVVLWYGVKMASCIVTIVYRLEGSNQSKIAIFGHLELAYPRQLTRLHLHVKINSHPKGEP